MSNTEEAVIVKVMLPTGDIDIFSLLDVLEGELVKAIKTSGAGEFDGNEIGHGELVLYMYGQDAERLFSAVASVLHRSELTNSASVEVRRGPPGAPFRTLKLNAN